MRKIYSFFFVLTFTFFNCNNSVKLNEVFVEDEVLIRKSIFSFFSNYDGNFRQADTTFLSNNLRVILKTAVAVEKASALEVKASRYPSDKPKILEGEIFSSLYEGFSTFSIKEVIMINDTFASSKILFTNHYYNEKWTDSVVLVNENGWKIDNVYFNKPALSTKHLLESFIVY